jgi:hypothetical protein
MVHHHLSTWKRNAIHSAYGKKDGRYFWLCQPSMKYSTPPHAPRIRQTSSNLACQPPRYKLYFQPDSRLSNWETTNKSSIYSVPAAMRAGTGMSGVINSQYVSSSQTNQQTTGYALSEISAASATSYKIVVRYANRRVYWGNSYPAYQTTPFASNF